MIFFESKQKKFLHFIKRRAAEKGRILCPNCGKEDINLLLVSECSACESPILTIDEKLSLRHAVEIVEEYIDKYDERTPRQIIDPIVLSCRQVLRTLANDKIPSNSEIGFLQRAFSNGTLGGLKFGGLIRLADGKPTIIVKELTPLVALNMRASEVAKAVATNECLYCVSLAIVRIQQQNKDSSSSSSNVNKIPPLAQEQQRPAIANEEKGTLEDRNARDLPTLNEMIKQHPEAAGFIEQSLSEFGDDPVPKIIQQLVADGLTADAQVMANIWLTYIGEPAIPDLIKLLGHNNYQLGIFSAKTLANIEGSMVHVKQALMSQNPKTRLHAAGSLQYFGSKGKELIPDLCDLIKREIIGQGAIEAGKIPEPAGVAAGALGKMGESGLPMVGELLNSDNVNIRLVAVSAFLRIGKSALPLLIEARAKEKDRLVFAALQDTISKLEKGV